nr:hypothetical protein [Tanacetum cinerariifolium]
MNQDSYNSNSLIFDQPQPSQSPVIHQPPQELSIQEMEGLKQQYLDELKCLSNLEYRDEIKIAELTENFNGMSIEIRKKEKLLQQEQWAYLSTHPSKRLHSFCFDNDDEDYTSAITPNAPGIPDHMCDVPFHDNSPPLDVSKDQFEDLSESNEEFSSTDDDSFSFDKIDYVEVSPPNSKLVSLEVMEIVIPEVGGIKASNDNPIPFYDPIISGTPSNLTPSGESDFFLEGDMLLFEAFLNDDHSFDFKTKSSFTSLNSLLEETHNFDNSLPEFTTFLKALFDAKYESDSSDDQSCSDEDVLEKIVSKPQSEVEIIPMKSLRTHDSSLPISSKIDSLLDEFVGELTLLKLIPPGIDETDCDFEEDIRLIEKLLYDNSSLRPPKEFVFANFDAEIKSFSPSPILVKDSDFLMEEIDLFCISDYPMSPGIKDKDYDSERDILILKDLPSNNTLDEFVGELTLLKLIPPGIDETDCDFEEDIRLIEKLLYDNSSPRPPKEFVFANSDAEIKSFSPSPILVKDSDFLMEEIDLFCSCSCVDGILVDGASWSIDVDTGESATSTALGAAATGIGETTIVGALKYSSNIGWNKRSQSYLFGGSQGC